MPIYEYQCEKCDYHFEKLQKIKEQALRECPKCEADALKKLVSAPSFQLKGSGWYETDFKNKMSRTTEKKNTTTENKLVEPKNKTTINNTQQDKAVL